ncbi:hypothetical protein EON63_05100, partial [archaeon]
PADGVYTYGLFLEGARWDEGKGELGESQPKVLFTPAPPIWWRPYRKEGVPSYPHYKCPVYKTSDRRYVYGYEYLCVYLCMCSMCVYVHVNMCMYLPSPPSFSPHLRGVLATTGHSSNFVCYIHMPSPLPEDHWVQRGVAMLTQLDD